MIGGAQALFGKMPFTWLLAFFMVWGSSPSSSWYQKGAFQGWFYHYYIATTFTISIISLHMTAIAVQYLLYNTNDHEE